MTKETTILIANEDGTLTLLDLEDNGNLRHEVSTFNTGNTKISGEIARLIHSGAITDSKVVMLYVNDKNEIISMNKFIDGREIAGNNIASFSADDMAKYSRLVNMISTSAKDIRVAMPEEVVAKPEFAAQDEPMTEVVSANDVKDGNSAEVEVSDDAAIAEAADVLQADYIAATEATVEEEIEFSKAELKHQGKVSKLQALIDTANTDSERLATKMAESTSDAETARANAGLEVLSRDGLAVERATLNDAILVNKQYKQEAKDALKLAKKAGDEDQVVTLKAQIETFRAERKPMREEVAAIKGKLTASIKAQTAFKKSAVAHDKALAKNTTKQEKIGVQITRHGERMSNYGDKSSELAHQRKLNQASAKVADSIADFTKAHTRNLYKQDAVLIKHATAKKM